MSPRRFNWTLGGLLALMVLVAAFGIFFLYNLRCQ